MCMYVCVLLLFFNRREFIGPLIGGALTEVYSFATSSFLFALVFGAVVRRLYRVFV